MGIYARQAMCVHHILVRRKLVLPSGASEMGDVVCEKVHGRGEKKGQVVTGDRI